MLKILLIEKRIHGCFDKEMMRTLFQKNGKTVYGGNIIANEECDSYSKKRFQSINASDEANIVGSFPLSQKEDIKNACLVAQKAFSSWSVTPPPFRGELLGSLARLLMDYKDALASLITREIGKTLKESLGSVQEAIDTAHFFQAEGRRLYGQTLFSELPNKELFTYRRPLGVVGVITAANFPIAVPSWKIIPALLCGNTVVWKPSEDAPTVAYVFSKLFECAGFPPGVLNTVFGGGGGGAGEALIDMVEENLVHKISFTGSTVVGKRIGETCGRHLQVPSLELGGKNPLIVMNDANLDLAVHGTVWGAFGTAGQRCTSTANIILHQEIAAPFKKKFLEKTGKLNIGNPCLRKELDYGPLINKTFFDRFIDHLEWGHHEGAILLYGSGRITEANKPSNFIGNPKGGCYVWPAIWDEVDISMKLAQEEIFGPTVNLITVSDFDEAMSVANGTPYGLSAAVYTQDPFLMLRFKNEIKSGMCSVNNSTTGAEAHLPFGGNGFSGNGTRESGIWVLDAFTRWQAVNVDLSGHLQLAQIEAPDLKKQNRVDLKSIL